MDCCYLNDDPDHLGSQQPRIERLFGDIEQLGTAGR
jgi:hypothetical protein